MELRKYNANRTKVLKINQIVRTVSETHKFDKDKLIAINTSDVENGVMGSGTLTSVDELKGQFKKTIVKDDILFSEIRPANRRFAKVTTEDTKDYVVSTKLMVLRKYNEDVDLEYFYYCLTNQPFLDILQRRAENRIGSFPQITFDLLSEYAFPIPPISEQKRISSVIATLDKKIALNRAINQNLEAMAKLLYDYWFVQFDFPNEEGKPYKSSGGEMLWNDKLKRNIPVGWHCGNLFEIAVFTNGLACQKFRPKDDEVPLPVIKIREMHDGISVDTEEVTSNIPESVKVYNGDVLFSWSASLEVMLWAYGLGGLNQHIFKVTSANDFPKSFYYFQLLDYVNVFKKMAEARKTTMGHITQDHLQQSTIAIPDNKDIADKFEELISPIFRQIVKLQEEISNLIKQRDELLPLLMNGQITIE
ncbi:restriction endonuclease subunit S [Bacteroides salyersiae]|uniref:restriction endonuclease subunit S n=1 Tax=Bacteroides salyersiae TaxID=291644 RepID=UPI001CC93925|nr:restriction endonuclease subunit S [Bacteroides salyersiae]UBD63411.1 restriction endonuclease subunit S [Bacteroides salyersiae]